MGASSEHEPPWDKIDPEIAPHVRVLWDGGIYTTESCAGGQGHPFPEPTVRFSGGQEQGWRALALAKENGLRPSTLRRIWRVIAGEPTGPEWELTFEIKGRGAVPVEKSDGSGTMTWKWV